MESFLLIAVFVILGIMFRRLPAFPPETVQVLNMFALYVSLPAIILLKAPQIEFSREALLPVAIAWGALLFSIILILALSHLLKWPRSTTGVLLLVVPLGNTSFLGVPIIKTFFGEAGLRHLILYDQLGTFLIFATYGSLILAIYGREGSVNLGSVAKRIVLFPPAIALVAGLTLFARCGYPPVIEKLLQTVATTLIPLVMTAIGFQLKLQLKPVLRYPVCFGLLLKLILAPAAALLLCRIFGIHGLAADVSILESGMPPMVTAGALAVVAGMDAELSTALVGIGLLVSFATLPLFFWLTRF